MPHSRKALNSSLVGILGCEFNDRRPDDSGLISWVMKVYCVGAWMRSDVVNPAQKVIRMTVRSVCSTLGENIGPTASYLDSVISNSQESQNALRRVNCARNEIPKFFKVM